MAVHRRGRAASSRLGTRARARTAATGPRPRSAAGFVAGPARGPDVPELGPRRGARWRGLRRRHRARRGAGAARARRRRPWRRACGRPGAGPGKVQGRNSTVPLVHPVPLPAGAWALTLQTTWVEPAYVEPDASWCRPGVAAGVAAGQRRRLRRQAPQSGGRPGPRRWPTSGRRPGPGAVEPGGRGALRAQAAAPRPRAAGRRLGRGADRADAGLARPGRAARTRVRAVAPGVEVEEVDIVGPPVGPELRGAVWAEVLAALHAARWPPVRRVARGHGTGSSRRDGARGRAGRRSACARAQAQGLGRGTVTVEVWAGEVLASGDPALLRLGAVHQALGPGVERGHRGGRRRGAARPDHPLLRDPRGPRDAAGRGRSSTRRTAGRSTDRTPCSPPQWPRPG